MYPSYTEQLHTLVVPLCRDSFVDQVVKCVKAALEEVLLLLATQGGCCAYSARLPTNEAFILQSLLIGRQPGTFLFVPNVKC